MALCALATEIQECQAIVVSLKIKFPNKKTSKGARKRQEEIFFFLVSANIGFRLQLLLGQKNILTEGENLFIRRKRSLCQEEENGPSLGRQFAFVFEMESLCWCQQSPFSYLSFMLLPLSSVRSRSLHGHLGINGVQVPFCSTPGVLASVGFSLRARQGKF